MNRAPGHTLHIATALAWEFWARGWRGILLAPLGALVLPGLIFSSLMTTNGQASTLNPRVMSLRGEIGTLLHFSFFWMTIVALGSGILVALGNPRHRYTLPASSLVLVAGPMACAMATIFVQYAAVALILNALFDAGWPILGPGLLAAVLIAWWQSVIWSTSNSVGLQSLCCLASSIPLLFAIHRWGAHHGSMTAELGNMNGWKALSFGVATIVCVGVGTFGFEKLRHGSGIDVRRIIDALSQLVPFRSRLHSAPFSSPTSAQFWLEWTERGFVLPSGTVLIGISALLLAWLLQPKDGHDFVVGVSTLFLAPLSVIAMFWGTRSPQGAFGNFNGSRPLSDCQLANAVLKSATLGLLLSFVIWAACMPAVVLIVGENAETSKLYRAVHQIRTVPLLAGIIFCAVALWCVVGFVTSLSLAGRKVFVVALTLAFGVGMVRLLVPFCLARESRLAFTQAYALALLVLCLLGCGATFVASWRRRLISMQTLGLAATIVLLAVVVAHFSELSQNWRYLPFISSCALIPIPLAAAPLAVYWNRHH